MCVSALEHWAEQVQRDGNQVKRTELGSILPNGYDNLRVAPVGGFSVVDVVAAMV